MKLMSLKVKNFKGLKSFCFEPNGLNSTIFGKNASGKSSLFDSLCYLLFDKDSTGAKQFSLKTLTAAGEELHNLEHQVEGSFELDDGQVIELRKTYTEKWTKKRGQAAKEFTGHTTTYHISDVPAKLKEYKETVAGIADESVFQLLTSPLFFSQGLHWKDRRELVLKVCGDVSDSKVISESDILKDLPELLGKRTQEAHRKIVVERRQLINKQLETIPVRIDEVDRGMSDLAGLDKAELEGSVAEIQKEIDTLATKRADILGGVELVDKRRQLSEATGKIKDLQRKEVVVLEDQLAAKTRERQDLMTANNKAMNDASGFRQQALEKTFEADSIQSEIEDLRKKWEDVENFTSSICPTCAQTIPKEQTEIAVVKAQDDISKTGKIAKERMLKLRAEAESLEKLAVKADDLVDADGETALIAEIERLASMIKNQAESAEMKMLAEDRDAIEKTIISLQTGQASEIEKVGQDIKDTTDTQKTFQGKLDLFEKAEEGKDRKKELAAEEKKLASEFEKLERELYLLDQFTRAKVDMLEEKINSRFKMARFKMFQEMINGGLAECCSVTYNGVPFESGLNHGHQLIVGCDIIRTLSEYYGVHIPLFIDNFEALTEPLDMPDDIQVIQLIASKDDSTLRVELEK